jgi:cold shock protein
MRPLVHCLPGNRQTGSRRLVQDAPSGPEGTGLWFDDLAGLLGSVHRDQEHIGRFVADVEAIYSYDEHAGGGRDVFVHISAVEKAGLTTLNEGQQIQYEEISIIGKTSAENLKVK